MQSYHDVVISGMPRLHNCSLTNAQAHTFAKNANVWGTRRWYESRPSEGVVVTGTMHPYNL
jgi:hypothetical protein